MDWFSKILFGTVEFSESEELLEFQYRCLILLQIFIAVISLMYVVMAVVGAIDHFDDRFFLIMLLFAVLLIASWLTLRVKKKAFLPLAWLTTLIATANSFLAFVLVIDDEVRILWMVVGIPFTMLVLGLKAGTVITLICIVSISFINPHIAMPLSQKALITTVMGILNQTIFFHAYYNRLVS